MRTRAIYGCSGTELLPDERRFFSDARPWGFILFGRNVVDRNQVRRLVDDLRESVGDTRAPVLIDQEGGRVMRLRPPEWQTRPAAARFGDLKQRSPATACEAAYLNARLMACDLAELGITVNCTPVLDVPVEGADNVIGDRAFGRDPVTVIELGRAVIEGMLDGGVLPVMKHMPGHGRAMVDSHKILPRVPNSIEELSATDFVTFRSLNHCPMAMTAHVVYETIDPQRPATTSPKIVRDIIRGEIGFDGVLLSDDLSMEALSGSLSGRTKAALFAGCDFALHCNGAMAEMQQVAMEAKPVEDVVLKRANLALGHLKPPQTFEVAAGQSRLAELLGAVE